MATKVSNVLSAIMSYLPDIQSVKGMNMLIGFMLLVSDMKEEEVFWALVALIKNSLRHDPLKIYGIENFYYSNSEDGILLNNIFDELFTNMFPSLKDNFLKVNLSDKLWIHEWIIKMFITYLPFGHCLRFWDYILSYGISGVLKLSLAIISEVKDQLENKDFTGCYAILNSFKIGGALKSPEEIILIADGIEINNIQQSSKRNYYAEKGSFKRQVTYEVNEETGQMEGIEDEPESGHINLIENLDTASRYKL